MTELENAAPRGQPLASSLFPVTSQLLRCGGRVGGEGRRGGGGGRKEEASRFRSHSRRGGGTEIQREPSSQNPGPGIRVRRWRRWRVKGRSHFQKSGSGGRA